MDHGTTGYVGLPAVSAKNLQTAINANKYLEFENITVGLLFSAVDPSTSDKPSFWW